MQIHCGFNESTDYYEDWIDIFNQKTITYKKIIKNI
jgi:hypothetical protein